MTAMEWLALVGIVAAAALILVAYALDVKRERDGEADEQA